MFFVCGVQKHTQMITNETRIIDLTVAELQVIIGKTVKSNLPSPTLTQEQNINDLGGIELAVEITGWTKATVYTKVHHRTMPFIKKQGIKKLFFSRSKLLAWLNDGQKATRQEIQEQAKHSLSGKK